MAASAENWKRKLLDLRKSNRALNFRINKVSTVVIVDEQPAEVFRTLYVRERPMRFKAAPEDPLGAGGEDVRQLPPAAPPTGAGSAEPDAGAEPMFDGDEDDPVGADFAPYDPTSLEERHTDEWLQTASSPEALDKSLRRLDEQARSALEEQGVHTLFLALGMLQYTEADASGQVFRAPLLLLPVELSRRSARAAFQIRAADEEPIVNPALAEHLRPWGIALPELPEAGAMADDYELQTFFTAVSEEVAGQKGWAVRTDIHLGLFSFQKFVMYKDLEANARALCAHRLVRQIVTRAGDHIAGLPAEIRSMELDREYPPEATFQVVDADSSQLRAIAACARDHDLVIEGPPGTGKSQTITNLIAQALAADKSVLFVAEKMAALEVVHSRLVQAGLGDACLELHSTKTSKRAVMKTLKDALDVSIQGVAAPTASTQRLPQVRHTLSAYVQAVHAPHGELGVAPFRAYGELGRVLSAPRVPYQGPVDSVTLPELEQGARDLQDLTAAAGPIGPIGEHPWRDAGRTFYSDDGLLEVRTRASGLLDALKALLPMATAVQAAFGLPEIRTFADFGTAASFAAVLRRSPGAPLAVLRSAEWNAAPPEALALVERGRELGRLKERAARLFKPEVLLQEHAADIAYVEAKSQGVFSFLSLLDARYRSVKRRWLAYRLPAFQGALIDQAHELKQVDRLRAERAALAAAQTQAHELFGDLWEGERSRWDALASYIGWVVEFRALCVRHGPGPRMTELAAKPAPDVSELDRLGAAADAARSALTELASAVGWPAGYLADRPLASIAQRIQALLQGIAKGPQWAAFEAARRTAERSVAGEILPHAMKGELPFQEAPAAFLRAFYMKWLSWVVQEREPLERFHTLTHEQRIAEFRLLDERVLLENRAALVSRLRDRVQHRLLQPDAAAQLPHLRREMARQRGLAPLRRTMRHCETAIRAIKPCFMMSPLTVAQYLDGSAPSFDLVIFDEASQLPTEDAVGAIIRGRQLVVVGDPKQLPPTNFFSVTSGQVSAPLADDGTPLYEDSESILEDFMGASVPMSRLKWHYRSAHESLIAFSNTSFYDQDLYTFPSVETGMERCGLQFEYVSDGVYEGKGLNQKEAQRVVDAVVGFAREQLAVEQHGGRQLSLGVGTFNLRQQLAIWDEIEQRRRQDPSIEPFFSRDRAEPFFVKNLENIQGDERDVIFISVTYAKGADGKLRYHFGPLNYENGWRRLNVLVTRARQQMRVFSSMHGEEIDPATTTSNGARLLRDFLIYAERGRLDGVGASAAADAGSPFERDVLMELSRRGVTVVPQVGIAGYRIDLGVLDDASPGRFLLGVECDGAAYRSSETARDRDRLRHQVLEARGWTIHRVWSTDWFKDRQGQIERLMGLIEEQRTRARAEAAEQEAGALAARRAAEALDSGTREELAPAGESAYVRPLAAPYVMAPAEGLNAGQDLLAAPDLRLREAVSAVVSIESPVHVKDLLMRVAGMWGMRLGARVEERILGACRAAEASGLVERGADFLWSPASGGACAVRSRNGTRIPGDRIAPEEYRQAILLVLGKGHAFSRPQLTNEVRSLFGFGRTGAVLDDAIGSVIDAMLQEGVLGEASTGIRIRRRE